MEIKPGSKWVLRKDCEGHKAGDVVTTRDDFYQFDLRGFKECPELHSWGHGVDTFLSERFADAVPYAPDQTLGQKASAWLRAVADMLEQKAVQYGDSAGQPVRMFSSSDMIEQLKVRADDKLSRLTRGTSGGEDAVKDLVGYIALLAAAGWSGNGK